VPPFVLGLYEDIDKNKHHVSPLILGMRGWEIPNLFVMYQAFKIDKLMKKKFK